MMLETYFHKGEYKWPARIHTESVKMVQLTFQT
jgi:hypothetical protein